MTDDDLKRVAAEYAADLVVDGQVIGLGTGTTVRWTIERLGERIRREGLHITAVATSRATETLALGCGIELITLDDTASLDLTIDGADEVSPLGDLIKGGGGALLREKVVAARSEKVTIVVHPDKRVPVLGKGFPLPVEVVPFARRPVAEAIRRCDGEPTLRVSKSTGETFVTDNGNWILDVRFAEGIERPAELEARLVAIPGLLECGLFVGLTDRVIVGLPSGPEVCDFKRARDS